METICAIFDFFSAFRHDFFFPANNFEAQIFLVIKNTQVVSCVLCSSFMHVLCNWHDAWIRPSKNLKTRNQMTYKVIRPSKNLKTRNQMQ